MKYFSLTVLLAFAVAVAVGQAQAQDYPSDEEVIVPMPRQLQEEDNVIIPMPRQNLNFSDVDSERVIIPIPRSLPQEEDDTPVIIQPRQISWQSYAISRLSDYSQFLQSENYPYGYSSNSQFSLLVTSPVNSEVVIDCQDFNLETSTSCSKDSMLISPGGRTDFTDGLIACGKRTFTLKSTGNRMAIRFVAGTRLYFGNFRFSCNIVAVPATTATTTTAVPTTTTAATTTTTTTVRTTTASSSSTTSSTSSASNCTCGARNEQPRIVGGVTAGVNEFPWRCFLYSSSYGAYCGASIVANEWIMTAAHCTDFLTKDDTLKVVCGDHDMTTNTETQSVVRLVDRFIQHPQYNNKTMDNDLSLLHITQPLTWSRTISPICLPWANQGNNCEGVQNTMIASGWGILQFKGEPSNVLRKVELPCLSTTQCQAYYRSAVTNNMICTYSPDGKDSCQGDSGGSLDWKSSTDGRYYALGVVSWGQGCAALNSPGVYVKLTNYLTWIKSTTGATFCQ